MRSSAPLLALLLAFAGLAGCLGGGEDEPGGAAPAGETATQAALDANATNESVDGEAGELVGEAGHQPHMHDYWMGRERVTLLDADVEAGDFEALAFTFFNVVRGTPGVGGAFIELPEGAIVYEGTGSLEFTATWTDPTVTGVGLSYRTPASSDFSQPQPLQPGAAALVEVKPEMTDMPHAKESRWAFLLVPAQAGQAIVGKVHVKVDIVRMRDITLFPGHPDLFGGAPTLTLYSGPAVSTTQNVATRIVGFASGSFDDDGGVSPQKVVPMETMAMTANVTITSSTSSLGEVSNFTFIYKAADTGRYARAQLLSADAATGTYQFGWPVRMTQTDSPYASESQWRFDLLIRTDPARQGWETSGLADAEVEYQLEVVAYDALPPGIEPPPDVNDDGDDEDE